VVDQEFPKRKPSQRVWEMESRSGVQGQSPGLRDKVSKKMKQNLLMSTIF